MKKRHKETTIIFVAIVLLFQIPEAQAETPWMYDGNPHNVLLKMQQYRARLKNLQCLVQYDDFQTYEAQRRVLNDAKQAGIPSEIVKQLEDDLASPGKTKHKYQIQKIILDSSGRAKIELTTGTYDASDKKIPAPGKSVDVWDGNTSIAYAERPGIAPPGAILGNTRSKMIDVLRRPLRSFGGQFVDAFSTAISDGKNIEIEENEEDGTLQITFVEGAVKNVGIVDPSKSFSVVKFERYRGKAIFVRFMAKFTEFKNGIWFPKEGKIESFFDDGQQHTISIVKVAQIKINDPAFDEKLFHLDFPKGTRVADTLAGLQFVVGDPLTAHLFDNQETVSDIALKAVGDGEDTKEILIPKMEIALRDNKPFVFDSQSLTLINAPGKIDTEETYEHFKKLVKGDLVWNDDLLATRDAKIISSLPKKQKSLTYIKGKWSTMCKLPEDVELPYLFILRTREDINYLVTINKIESKGIWITCVRKSRDQVKYYEES